MISYLFCYSYFNFSCLSQITLCIGDGSDDNLTPAVNVCGGCHIIIRKTWLCFVVFGKFHYPCTLSISFVDLPRHCVAVMPKSRNWNFRGNYIFMILELARYVPLYSKILKLLTNHKWKFYHVRKSGTLIGHKIRYAKISYLELRGFSVPATIGNFSQFW